MKHYGLKIAEGTQITNTTVASGTSFPANESVGEVFYRSDEDLLYIWDGAQWVQVGGNLDPITYYYTSTAGQTAFSGLDDNGQTLTYTAGNIFVYINGVLIDPGEYTATNGTSVVFTEGTALSDEVVIQSLQGWSANTIDGGTY